jgi:hypothetical protein
MTLSELEKRVASIELRNNRVEDDKAWEVSRARKLLLLVFTYVGIGLYMWVIEVKNPWLNAVVPTIGFWLSTLTLPYFREWWLKERRRKSN